MPWYPALPQSHFVTLECYVLIETADLTQSMHQVSSTLMWLHDRVMRLGSDHQ